jgi:hypothetical protein
MPNIPTAKDGDWIEVPDSMRQKIVCCDCGLVHRFEFRVVKRKLQWRAYRDPDFTEQVREDDRAREATIGAELPAGWLEKMGLTDPSFSS